MNDKDMQMTNVCQAYMCVTSVFILLISLLFSCQSYVVLSAADSCCVVLFANKTVEDESEFVTEYTQSVHNFRKFFNIVKLLKI